MPPETSPKPRYKASCSMARGVATSIVELTTDDVEVLIDFRTRGLYFLNPSNGGTMAQSYVVFQEKIACVQCSSSERSLTPPRPWRT